MDLIQKKTTKTKMVNRVALRRNIMQSLEDLDPIFLTYVVQDPNLYRDRFVLEFLRRSVETQRDDLLEKLVELKFTTPAEITDLFILYNLFPVAEERIQNGILPTHEAELCAAMNLDITALEFLEKHGFHPTNRDLIWLLGLEVSESNMTIVLVY